MRVVIADDLQPAAARGPVRGDQGPGIELKMTLRLGVNIGRRLGQRDLVPLPQQQSATLTRVGALRFFDQCGNRATCHQQDHPHLLSNE